MRIVAVIVALLGAQAFAKRTVSASDREFLVRTAARNHADGKLGELALERGIDPSVKALGRRMIDSSDQIARNLAPVARRKGVSLPRMISADDATLVRRLARLRGDDFDRQFLDVVGERQKRAADDLELHAGSRDGDIGAFAARNEMILHANRDLASDARQSL
jgi:putative membrane protein